MLTRNTILLLTGAAAVLTACGPSSTPKNLGVESINQPVVARSDYVFDAATDGAGLAPGERARVAGWLASLRLSYGDRVYVDDPAGTGVRNEVAAEANRYGILLSENAPVTTGAIAPGTARVIVSRMRASVPGCPNWARDGKPETDNAAHANYGCSVNSNLAAMIARPEDLVRGQPGAETADPTTNLKAIETLRKAPPSGANGLKADGPGGGK
jgi:pilus assembly protein CpaD